MRNNYLWISLLLFFSCAENTEKKVTSTKIDGYFEGMKLYEARCAVCHQSDGKGNDALFPPLKSSDFLQNNQERLSCIIRNGLNEKITVNNKEYKVKMPGNDDLSAQEIHQLSNYINNSWSNNYGTTTLEKVKKDLNNCQ